jgi:TetR/AcrR family transcriptional regulator, cholesterol catabolism regulator
VGNTEVDNAVDGLRLRRATDKATKADISRERVLAAAAKIFSERGYAGTTVRAVAKEVGLQAGSLYYHYRSKEELIEAVLDIGINGVSETVRNAIAALPPDAAGRKLIETAVLAHLKGVVAYEAYALSARRVLGQVPAHVRRKHVRLRDAYGEFWLHLLEAAQLSGDLRAKIDVRLARIFILGALNSAVDWYKPQGKALDDVAKQFSLLISDGLFVPSDHVQEDR